MELFRIIISEISEGQQICLREIDGDRVLKIMIGTFEATCIDRRVTQFPEMALGRPMTHELMASIIDSLGGQAEQVTITELIEHTYYALIRIKKGDEIIEIDARPSDAIALATIFNPPLPIYVAESVLDES